MVNCQQHSDWRWHIDNDNISPHNLLIKLFSEIHFQNCIQRRASFRVFFYKKWHTSKQRTFWGKNNQIPFKWIQSIGSEEPTSIIWPMRSKRDKLFMPTRSRDLTTFMHNSSAWQSNMWERSNLYNCRRKYQAYNAKSKCSFKQRTTHISR